MLLMRKLKSCSYFAFTKSAQLKLTMMKLIWTYEPFPASFPFLALSHLPKYCKSYSDFSPNKPRQSLVKQSKLLKKCTNRMHNGVRKCNLVDDLHFRMNYFINLRNEVCSICNPRDESDCSSNDCTLSSWLTNIVYPLIAQSFCMISWISWLSTILSYWYSKAFYV